jgi:hypothetical protein
VSHIDTKLDIISNTEKGTESIVCSGGTGEGRRLEIFVNDLKTCNMYEAFLQYTGQFCIHEQFQKVQNAVHAAIEMTTVKCASESTNQQLWR